MVIINKAKAKVFRQTKKGFAKVFAVVLSMAVVVSTFAFSIPTASAKGESPFIDCEEIFIDMRSFTGWTSKSASFRVFTFYNDSDNPNWCHEYEGNFDNDGWYEGSNVLAKGIVPVKFCDNVYSFRIPSTKISHLRVVRTNSDGTEKWNLSPMMWDNQRSKYEAGNSGKYYSKQNCIKITGWDSAEWSQFRPSKNSSYSNLTANPDTSITGNSNLFTIDATFYDYYNDDEINFSKDDEFDINDYLPEEDRDDYSYKLQANNYSSDDDPYEAPIVNEETFQDYLNQQLAYRDLTDKQLEIGEYIIGNLDDNGYLNRPVPNIADDLLFTMNLSASEDEVNEVLKIVQELDPPGIAARDLQECLLIQLKNH